MQEGNLCGGCCAGRSWICCAGRSEFGRRGTRRSQTARAWPRAAQQENGFCIFKTECFIIYFTSRRKFLINIFPVKNKMDFLDCFDRILIWNNKKRLQKKLLVP